MKRKIYTKVVKYRKQIMIFYAFLVVVCALMIPKVNVDYDVVHYLPKDSPSVKALRVMAKEFGANLPNNRVMIQNVSETEAKDYKEKLESIDGVLDVTWVDSMLPLNMPIEAMPASVTESYYKDGNALFIITIDGNKETYAVQAIYDLIGEDNQFAGNSVTTVVATINTVKEVVLITIIAIIFLVFVLTITTNSWIEPLIILLGLVVAVIINAGTNLIFGTISFVTNSTGMVLQMAVALDYSVFLIHRFNECKEAEPDTEKAMVEALTMSSSSILSSGLTTFIGFLALAFMRFLIGADLGIALSKGVAVSLITTLVFMPGVILGTYKLMERTQHRPFLPSFEKFGKFILKVTGPLMIVFMLLVIPAFLGSWNNHFLYGGSHIYGPGTRVGDDTQKIQDVFGDEDSYVLMVPRGDRAKEAAMIQELNEEPLVINVLSPESVMGLALPAEMLPDSMVNMLRTEKYDRIVLSVAVPPESEEAFALIKKVKDISEEYYPGEYYLAGSGVTNYDLKIVITSDMVKVDLIAILAIFVVLVLTMQNLLLPVILVLVIETAIWLNMSISYLTGTPIFYIVYMIISAVQLGATVDYAILFTQRYRENRMMLHLDPKQSVVKTVTDNTVSIMTSAFTVSFMGFLLAIFSTQGMIAQMGLLLGRGTICSLFAVLFVLPGLLMLFDKWVIHSYSLKDIFGEGKKEDKSETAA